MWEEGPVIHQTLLWTPRAKQRPRTAFKQGAYRTFTPKETQAAEKALAEQWVGPPLEGYLAAVLDLHDDRIEVDLSSAITPESKKLLRGDLDNYVKLIQDALNGVAWIDDKQIVTLVARKM
jgi:Holliday junction resolvase RusA-like endonuclease